MTTREEAEAALLAEFSQAIEVMDTFGPASKGGGWEAPGALAVDPNGNLAVRKGAVSVLVDHAFMVMSNEAYAELTRIIMPKQNEVQKILHLLTLVNDAEHALNIVNGVKVFASQGGKKLQGAVYVDSTSPHLMMLARDFASDLLRTDAYEGVHILGAGYRLWRDVNNEVEFELAGKDEDDSPFSVVNTGATEYAAHKREFERGHVDPFGDMDARISKLFKIPMTMLRPSTTRQAKELLDRLISPDMTPRQYMRGLGAGGPGITVKFALSDAEAEEIRQRFRGGSVHGPITVLSDHDPQLAYKATREAILNGNVYIERKSH